MCKVIIDNQTTWRIMNDDRPFESLQMAIDYYVTLYKNKPIELYIDDRLVWRSEIAKIKLNKNQLTLF
jgi:hypothetical protein